jgi:hypothetical protein
LKEVVLESQTGVRWLGLRAEWRPEAEKEMTTVEDLMVERMGAAALLVGGLVSAVITTP